MQTLGVVVSLTVRRASCTLPRPLGMTSLTAQAWPLCCRAQAGRLPRPGLPVLPGGPGKPPQGPGASPSPRASGSSEKGSVCSIPKTSEVLSRQSWLQQRWAEGARAAMPTDREESTLSMRSSMWAVTRGLTGGAAASSPAPGIQGPHPVIRCSHLNPPPPSFITHSPCCPPINFHSISRPPYSRFIHSHPNSAPALRWHSLGAIPALATGIRKVGICGPICQPLCSERL